MNLVHVSGMARDLPLSALHAFEAVTRTGSFRAAADDLCLTPSAVSHAIKSLERSLGMPLFVRDGRAVLLTPEGERLMHHVERGFNELQLGIGSIRMRGPRLLRLHCAPTFAALWLLPRLRRLLEESNGLDVRIAADANYTRFVEDEFDADIVYGEPTPQFYGKSGHQGVIVLPLGTELVTPLCAPSVAPRIGTPRDLLNETLIVSDQKKVQWSTWFAVNKLAAPEPRGLRFDRSFLSLTAASDGLGVALESLRLAERELEAGRLVQPLHKRCQDVSYTGHFLVFPRAKGSSQALRRFLEWLGKELGLDDGFSAAGIEKSGIRVPRSRADGRSGSENNAA